MALEGFQQNTVDAAYRALRNGGGSRRFLIADEVGLGKTISSKAVAQRLKRDQDDPLNVVYLCPNLDIASQNLTKLTSLDETWETPPDRLSLAAAMTGRETVEAYRLFSYTPDTSLPGWKAGQRAGRAEERWLIAGLFARIAPKFWRSLKRIDDHHAAQGHNRHFTWTTKPPKHLPPAFRAALIRVLQITGTDLDAELRGWLKARDNEIPEFVLRARAALALVALINPATRPHLLILDEFHRFADLILPRDGLKLSPIKAERFEVQRLLVRTMLGEDSDPRRPALLLMSATPYRLLRVDGTEVEASRYRSFIRLVRFLFGDNAIAAADQAAARITAHHQALQSKANKATVLKTVRAAKLEVEAALRPIIARTERATTITTELFDRRSHAAVVEADDLRAFRHFAHAVSERKPALSGWVTTLWSSVPYPAETLFEYKISDALTDVPTVNSARATPRAAHPQLRAAVTADATDPVGRPAPVDLPLLGLPWLAPTAPWWRLGGPWADLASRDRPVGKALLFSRYIATPLSISAVLSLDVHRRQPPSKTAQPYLRYEAKTPWPLIASFMPWPSLIDAIDPARDPASRASDVTDAANAELRAWLLRREFRIEPRGRASRKPWELAIAIERAYDRAGDVGEALREVPGLPTSQRRQWRAASTPTEKPILSRDEVRLLAAWLLSSPGMIIGRSLLRHQPELLEDAEGLRLAFAFCWHDLRPYLGQRTFGGAILPKPVKGKRHSYPAALRRAIVRGGFEAVIDEHIAVMRLIGDETPIDYLRQSFFGRAGRVRMRRAGVRKPARITVHAAVPYAGAERVRSKASKEGKLRSDNLRRAFNSPFWPHVLATTSVGQEGLDFHVWCDRIIHWDLPRDPVDFEQREGRIARYASLCVRRALARDYASAAQGAGRGTSPFWKIFEAARAASGDGRGLQRWWSPPDHRPISITFDVRFSQNTTRLKELQADLTRYRLALGQPEPSLFEDMVKHFGLATGQARELALDLSAPAAFGDK